MSYTLYGYEGNPRTRICQITAKYEGIDFNLVDTNPATKSNQETLLEKFPQSQGRIPALEGPGIKINEVIAVAYHLISVSGDPAKLLGRSKEEAAEVIQWASFANSQVLPPFGDWFRPLVNPAVPYNKQASNQAEQKFNGTLSVLEKLLLDRTYLVGDRLTLADIFLSVYLFRGFEFVLDAAWRSAHPNVMRHFQTVVHQPNVAAVVGEAKFVEKKIEYTAPKKEAKKEPKPAAAAAPKAEKKKAAKEDDDDEPAAPAEPKAKHHCETLGPAKCFPLDEWKRQYSNSDFPKAMEWLSSNLDESEYTFWRLAYKYDDELTQVFMSSNLIGGLHNRLEASRKYLFGSMGVYGKSNASKIQGAYMIRGDNAEAVFSVAPDWECYVIERLDFKKDSDYIKGCWNWDNQCEGLEYADGKVFK